MKDGFKNSRLKYHLKVKNGREIINEVNYSENAVNVYGSGGIFKYTDKKLFTGPSVLFGRKGTIGKPLYVDGDFWTVDTMYYTKIYKGNSPRYFYYLLEVFPWNQIVTQTALPSIVGTEVENFEFNAPSYKIQNKIAKYLDYKCGEINELLIQKEKLVILLEQQRQSIITEAVTKGLDPNVKMKDSGVEWIGEIPDHWNIIAFKRISKRVEVGIAEAATHAYRDNGIPIIRATNLKNGKFNEDELLFLSEEFAQKNNSKYIFENDLLTVRTGNAGLTGVVPKSLNMSQCFTMLISTLNVNINPYFYSYFLNSTPGKTYFNLTAWGTAQKNISVPILKEMLVPIFSHFEQAEIVRYLQENDIKFDNLVSRLKKQIKKLKEYRKVLVYEVVTGNIDVRD